MRRDWHRGRVRGYDDCDTEMRFGDEWASHPVADARGDGIMESLSRVRWWAVALVLASVILAAKMLLPSVASSHEDKPSQPEQTAPATYGPSPSVSYSPITDAERKAEAEEEIRRWNEEHGISDEKMEEAAPDTDLLVHADSDYQHEGDLGFDGANRDNTIARATLAWERPSWLSNIDWNRVRESLGIEGDWSDMGDEEQADETTAGYDDIARVMFSDGVPFEWTSDTGAGFSYDGGREMSGDMAMCLDTIDTVVGNHHAILALDKENDALSYDTIRFDEANMGHHSFAVYDKVVPESQKATMMACSAGGTALRELTIWRRHLSAEVTRDSGCVERGEGGLYLHVLALSPPGMMSDETVFAGVESNELSNLGMWVSYNAVRVETTDERGLRGAKVDVTYVIDGETKKLEQVLETDEQSAMIELDVDRGNNE